MLKSHQLGVAMQVTKRVVSHREGRFSLCNTAALCNFIPSLTGFYWIPLFTILLLLYVFEVDKAKRATQSVVMILTLNGLFQKNFQVFYFSPEN